MKLSPHNSENGFSLIEVLIALVILVIVILGGGLYFFYGRLGINREGYRRAALELASQRLEKLKAADYSKITPNPDDPDGFDPGYAPYYIVGGDDWNPQEDLAYDYVTVGNLTDQKMLTQAQYIDDDGVGDSYDYLKITVTVKWNIAEWSDNTTNKVELVTLIAP